MTSEKAKEVTIPVILLVAGVAVYAAGGLWYGGVGAMARFLLGLAVQLIFGVPLAILACFITARIMGISFGYLKTAVLKLAAIFVFCGAVTVAIPYAGWLISLGLFWGLLGWLFDLEFMEVVVLTVVMAVMNWLIGGILAAAIVAATQ